MALPGRGVTYQMECLSRHERQGQRDELVSAACGLVESNTDVRSVRIVTGGCLAYAELCRYRKSALARHVHLSVNGRGIIAVAAIASP